MIKIEVTEVLQRTIEVDVNDFDQAYDIVRRKYFSEEIVLDGGDFVDFQISAFEK